jgi:phosphoglycerol transferase
MSLQEGTIQRQRGPALSRPAFLYILLGVVTLAIFVAVFGPSRFFSAFPIYAAYDSGHHLALAKALIEQGWFWNIERLSAPFTLPMAMFPVGGTLDYAIIKLIGSIWPEPGFAIKAFYALGFALSAMSAAFVLIDLGFDRLRAAVFALLFAFSPFLFYRATHHLMLVTYLVPFGIGYAMRLIRGTPPTGRTRVVYLTAAALLGLNYIYTAFFACFFVALATVVAMLGAARWRSLLAGCLFVGLCVVTLAISLTPAIIAGSRDPAAVAAIRIKAPMEADLYGFKIRHIFLPSANSKVAGPLRRIMTEGFPLENENVSARLGLVGAVGFTLLMAAALMALALRQAPQWVEALRPPSGVAIVAVLLATIGGFGSMFNALVSPEIRTYNRISPFILFLSLMAVGIAWAAVTRRWSRRVATIGLLLVLGIGLFEQTEFGALRRLYDPTKAEIEDVKPLIERLEQTLPRGASLYQMPHTAYPHTPNDVFGMRGQEHFLPYVLSTHLRWSYPALSSQAITFQGGVQPLPPIALVEALSLAGFSAVWINRAGYGDRADHLISELRTYGAVMADEDAAKKFAVLDLRPVIERLHRVLPPPEWERRRQRVMIGTP